MSHAKSLLWHQLDKDINARRDVTLAFSNLIDSATGAATGAKNAKLMINACHVITLIGY